MNRLSRSVLTATVTAALAVSTLIGAAAPAWAAGSVSVAGIDGAAVVSSENATDVTVTGTGFQSIPNGFGGIYVLFGWVDDAAGGSWRPSAGGVVGEDYRYVPDAESADNNGYQRFLAFPGSQTESSANGVVAADGSWSVSMVVPGATFESQDRDGNVTTVDCRRVTCGVITIGAHGVKNANNESFTPLSFRSAAAPAAPTEDAAAAPAATGGARVGVEAGAVRAGSSIVFTGQGFTPGEQVVAALDGGLTAVGPLTAGAQGEVAAALPVPRDIRDGTHLLTLRGAGSGGVAESEVTVTGGVVADPAASAAPVAPVWAIVLMLACIALSLVLVVASIVTAIARARARRRARRGGGARSPGDESASVAGGGGAEPAAVGVSRPAGGAVDVSGPAPDADTGGSTSRAVGEPASGAAVDDPGPDRTAPVGIAR